MQFMLQLAFALVRASAFTTTALITESRIGFGGIGVASIHSARKRISGRFRQFSVWSSSLRSLDQQLSSDMAPQSQIAQRVDASNESLIKCAERLRSGELVSFPTETVYGLGCHALDEKAVRKVFEAKRRPLSDPLIVHVVTTAEAFSLWDLQGPSSGRDMDAPEKALVALMEDFWPGPLTLIYKANESVPSVVTAETGFVAARCPSHVIARQLISLSKVPIAAPSANRFGHVSPTRAEHVMSDLGGENLWVVDPGESSDGKNICAVGVESTVAKVEDGTVSILRHGAISPKDIENCLTTADLGNDFKVQICVRTTGEEVHNVAPGQTIKHYSPDVPSYIISQRKVQMQSLDEKECEILSKSVLLDFGQRLNWIKGSCLAYRDLSSAGSSSEAAMQVFDSLRWAELVVGAERVFFPELIVADDDGETITDDALILAIKDRLTRAASGIVVDTFQ